ncbi:MAG: FAD-dependent oxidoreductase, partial [Lentisphaerae bacterium]|nr:FAD-dependent oxidoreductase [Lentisphaerota bacterium]
DMARYFMDFVQEESCGKCVPCRVGTNRILEILERICAGTGEMADLERLEQLSRQIMDTSLCGLGQTAANPVLSTLRHFRDEYIAHIRDKRCPAGVCPALVVAPCQNACPAGVDVPGFVSLTGEQRYSEALRLHRERNPFAVVCAAVCFHPCESRCRRASLDDPVAIRSVKRFMVEQEQRPALPEVRRDPANAAKKIAIIGAGPAGLSCAYFLARLGYAPRVLEAEQRPGGMLVQAIPAYRLPRAALERELKMIQRLGVTIQTGHRLGRDFSLADLKKEGYAAVYLAVGAPLGSQLQISGPTERIVDGITFLRDFNLGRRPQIGREILIIGGGNVAIDVARTMQRLGAQSVTVIYRRTREQMPAYAAEVAEAQREGVRFVFLAAPAEMLLEGDQLVGLRCQKMQLGAFDRSGRRRAEPMPGETFVLAGDQIVAAIGQQLRCNDFAKDTKLNLIANGWLQADPLTGQTAQPWLFAGGDALTGPASVVEAIAAGERAAVAMDAYLSGAPHAFWRQAHNCDTFFDPDADPLEYPRAAQRLLPLKQRRGNFKELELPLSKRAALREARRCLRCDYREPTTQQP